MSIYPPIVEKLKINISARNAKSVAEVWTIFKETFLEFELNKPQFVSNAGIMAEVNFGGTNTSPIFYFSIHYLVDDESSYSEWVYCEFRLSEDCISQMSQSVMELWDWDFTSMEMFQEIENWMAFKVIKNKELQLIVHGSES
ncbi:hypothetical protein [Thalassotalea sp. PS06]|uniref:hypothetical protein n=1 Tax=Thalassotalea sp. PS06 TaxID=2594005 RepID=UPI0011648A62|nr:hypothetical protein [Thalassotalea sp. PS06]QDP00666.1 hypothetical protein FNC98_04435 [Thalassotalea sp. PS06]